MNRRPGISRSIAGSWLAAVLLAGFAATATAQMMDLDRPAGESPSLEETEKLRRDEMRRRLGGSTTEAMRLPGAIDPAGYRVGAGDLLQLTLWGGVSRTIPMEVNPEGTVQLPTTGPMHVEGKLLGEVRKEILARLRPEFRGVNMDLQLVRPRRFVAYMTGQVRFPGTVDANGASRAGDLVLAAEPLADASLRNIELIHRDGSREIADLDLFLRTASQSLNPWLRDGDVIHVPTRTRLIHLQGAVAQPGDFELGSDDSLRTLVALGGGLLPSADTTRALMIRWVDHARTESVWVHVPDMTSGRYNPPLRGGDRLYVYFIPRYQEHHEASVTGEILRPGVYPIRVGRDRISDVVRAAGGFLPGADLASVRVRRVGPTAGQEDPELQRLLRLSRRDLTNSEYDVLQTKLASLREEYRIDWNRLQIDPALDVLMVGGDEVLVDRLVSSIRVDGQVRRPGILTFTPGLEIQDYVTLAGGYSDRAWRSKIRVTRSVTGQTFYAKDVSRLDPGDFIWVPEKPDVTFWDQTRVILTAAAEIATVILAFEAVTQ